MVLTTCVSLLIVSHVAAELDIVRCLCNVRSIGLCIYIMSTSRLGALHCNKATNWGELSKCFYEQIEPLP